jgi:hypothetical protein
MFKFRFLSLLMEKLKSFFLGFFGNVFFLLFYYNVIGDFHNFNLKDTTTDDSGV